MLLKSISLPIDDHIIRNLPKRFYLAALLSLIGVGADIPWVAADNEREIFLLRGMMIAGALFCSFLSRYCHNRLSAEILTIAATLGLVTNMAIIGSLEGTYLTGYLAAVYQTLAFLVVFIPIRTGIFAGLVAVTGLLWFWVLPLILSTPLDYRLFVSHIFGYVTYAFMSIAGNYTFFQLWTEKEKQRLNLEDQSHRLKELASRDGLTGVYNFRHFQELFPDLVQNAKNQHGLLTLCLIDLDGFKSINDNYGHVTGNYVLEHVSRCLTASIRSKDSAFRIGGDEFAVTLPDTGSDHAWQVIERFQKRLHTIEPQNDIPQVECSVGVAEFCPQLATADAIIEAADQALYKAKELKDEKIVKYVM